MAKSYLTQSANGSNNFIMSDSDVLISLTRQLSEAYRRGNIVAYQSLLYNDLRELIVSGGDEVSHQVVSALKLVSEISSSREFVESYLGAFCYFYRFSVRRSVGIFSPPVEFGFKYDYRQRHFNEFRRLLERTLPLCSLRQQLYYAAITKTPGECTKMAAAVIDDSRSTRSQRKNAAILACNSIWRNKNATSSMPHSFLNGIRSKKTEAVVRLFMMKLDFKSASALLKDVADEDAEVEWCQSFFSVIVTVGILFSFPNARSVDLVFEEIRRLRDLLQKKRLELEFDAYKCLNEDAALLLARFPSGTKPVESRQLVDYFLLRAREERMQSHELLRQGVLVADSEATKGRDRVQIYDYSTEIVRV